MTVCDFLLMRGPDDTDPLKIMTLELPEAPAKGDNFTHEGRGYLVLGRSWQTLPRKVEGECLWAAKLVLLVRQIAGPAHALEMVQKPRLIV